MVALDAQLMFYYSHKKSVLPKFHEDWPINLSCNILRTNENYVPTKFHKDWTYIVISTVLTRFYYHCYFSHIKKTALSMAAMLLNGQYLFSKPSRFILKTNVLTKFHEDWIKNKTSGVKTGTPSGRHVFQRTGTNFGRSQDIIGTTVLTKFHED
ncbi:hypothetical protein DPMN_064356 [Dreissena polymorpha]|uniref:Uncharacterized protein n=1 Tax=Dreissena polymorpha TaxID=45954 RepID=A0A9D4CD22_DREPO|nr:hypothetical protein DPMN_064356 [Dreissena polymorpha]